MLDYVDTTARLVAAAAVVFAAVIASRYESRMTSISLLNQREQSESALRASMFQNLIDPIVGQPTSSAPIPPDRERLLAELLTLNFHDHFEFKPLLLEVDKRLVSQNMEADRNALSSTARRVIDRQINMLNAAQANYNGEELPVTTLNYVDGKASPTTSALGVDSDDDHWTVISPDAKWEVTIDVLDVDFAKRTVKLSLNAKTAGERKGLDFELSQFDFPLTDYTQLDRDHRLALSLFDIHPEYRAFAVKFLWFPRGYITERERPFDYRSIRNALNLDTE